MAPIVLAAAVWGQHWPGKSVLFCCDNDAVVVILRKGSANDENLLHSLRCLAFLAAHYDFIFTAQHLPGKHNQAAYALSRGRTEYLCSLCPQANKEPMPLPQSPGVVHTADARLDVTSLEAAVHSYFRAGIAVSTTQIHDSAKRQYTSFCREVNLPQLPLQECVCLPHTLPPQA